MKPRLPAFEVLVDMARNDPQGLEKLRRSLTDAVIAAASNETTRRRLQGLQFRVDMERRRATTPLAATIRISEMMCRSLAALHRSMVAPATQALPEDRASTQGQVLDFRQLARPEDPLL